MSSKTNAFFRGISTQTIITVIRGFLEIIVFSVLSRLLTKSEFGYFAALTAIIAVTTSISEAGLGSALIQKKDASASFISTTFTLSWIVGALFAIIVFLISPWLANVVADNTLVYPLKIMSLNVFLYSVISVGNGILYRNLQFARAGIILLLAYLLSSIVTIYMAANGYGLFSVVIGSVLNSLLYVAILFSTSVKMPRFFIKRDEVPGVISFGGWLTFGVILNTLTHQIDKLVLSKWLSVKSLGAYNRPAGLVSTVSTQVNGIFDTVLFPMLSDIQDNPQKIKNVFKQSIVLLNFFSAILACGFIFNADLIVKIFFGEEWLEVVPLLRVISISVLFNIDGRLVDCFFRSLAYVKLGFYLRLVGAFLMITALFLGVRYGLMGVAYGVLAANVITIMLKIYILCNKVDVTIIDVLKSFLRALVPLLPLAVLGLLFMYIVPNTFYEILYLSLFCIFIIVELLFYPSFVSNEYKNILYPTIEKIVFKKLLNRIWVKD